jgi:hypothetical protein
MLFSFFTVSVLTPSSLFMNNLHLFLKNLTFFLVENCSSWTHLLQIEPPGKEKERKNSRESLLTDPTGENLKIFIDVKIF